MRLSSTTENLSTRKEKDKFGLLTGSRSNGAVFFIHVKVDQKILLFVQNIYVCKRE